jgi:hypothetical protein
MGSNRGLHVPESANSDDCGMHLSARGLGGRKEGGGGRREAAGGAFVPESSSRGKEECMTS